MAGRARYVPGCALFANDGQEARGFVSSSADTPLSCLRFPGFTALSSRCILAIIRLRIFMRDMQVIPRKLTSKRYQSLKASCRLARWAWSLNGPHCIKMNYGRHLGGRRILKRQARLIRWHNTADPMAQ